MSQTASQGTQTSNLSKRRENYWKCTKKPAKLNNLMVYSANVADFFTVNGDSLINSDR